MPRTPALFEQGLRLHQQGQFAEAEQIYRRILRSEPVHFDALHLLGVLCGQTERLSEALDLLQCALRQRPGSAAALNNLGNTLGSLGQHDKAVVAFEQALALRPNDAKALCNRGNALRRLQRADEALCSFDAALALKADYPEALIGRAEALLSLKRKDEAVETFKRALPLGKDVEQLHFVLASLGAEPAPTAAPAGYVEALFDAYADNFDAHLLERLGYRTPNLLLDALSRVSQLEAATIADLGCGTGLCGPLLRPWASQLVGVDLSERMLAKAGELGAYDELVKADVVSFLKGRAQCFDLIVAADVLVYLGDLDATFASTSASLRGPGLFAFSVEACDAPHTDFLLGPTRRFSHSLAYIERLAARHGFKRVQQQRAALRKENDVPVEGWLVVVQRVKATEP
ncbi:MAG: tetratricopeptide repeat protein [Burkholderiales bacterium]